MSADTPTPTFDAAGFRHALGSFTTGVTIITTRTESNEPVGLTANSFNSVSLDPPLVLWSLARTSRNLLHFTGAEHFAVHILSAEQEHLSNRFAKAGEDKFAGLDIEHGAGALPLLPGCAARLQCRTRFQYEGGDHVIFVGEVLAFDRFERAPLVFHGGGYALALRKAKAAAESEALGPGVGDDMLDFLLPRAHYQIYSRMRRIHEQADLCDAELFVLVSLVTGGRRKKPEIQRMFGLTGHRIEPAHLASLQDRALIVWEPGDQLQLTDAGRNLALRMLAAAKDIESEVIDRLGANEAQALKLMLKRLVQVTEIGLPPMWQSEQP